MYIMDTLHRGYYDWSLADHSQVMAGLVYGPDI